jgi:hypothetical protein
MRLPEWLDPPAARQPRKDVLMPKAGPIKEQAARPEGDVPEASPRSHRSSEEAPGKQERPFTATPVVGTFAVVAGLALFPIAALLLCIGILALVHAIF